MSAEHLKEESNAFLRMIYTDEMKGWGINRALNSIKVTDVEDKSSSRGSTM